jgi:tetratricopeptide (TPR) repeat protein
VKKAVLFVLVIMLLAAALLQWGLDSTPAGTDVAQTEKFPAASSLLDLLGGARQYVAFIFYIKADEVHHAYYGSFTQEAELVPYFELIALLDPNYISAYYVGVGIMDTLGKKEEAIAFNRQGIAANPESADLHYSLGDLYLEEKRFAEAREEFEEALKYEPEIVSRNTLLAAASASCSAMGDREAQLGYLMEKAIYNQVRLYDDKYTYEQGEVIVELINSTLNSAMDIAGETDEGGGV